MSNTGLKQFLNSRYKRSRPPDRGSPITRALVQAALRDPDDDDQDEEIYEDRPTEPPVEDIDATLPQIREWLDDLADEEQSNIAWYSEYESQRIQLSHQENDLPSYLAKEELKDVQDPAIVAKNPGLVMNPEVLHRIFEGLGPRGVKIEDLLAPLRLESSKEESKEETDPGEKTDSREETYEELLRVLQEWNRHVDSIPNLTEEQAALVEALEERNQLIEDILRGKQKPEALDQPSQRLRQALLAFRPELGGFANKRTFDILVIMMANLRIANPDLDDEMRCVVIKAILNEVNLRTNLKEEHQAEKAALKAKMASARRRGNREEFERLKQERLAFNERTLIGVFKDVIDCIKKARRKLYFKVLDDIEELAVLQAEPKRALAKELSVPLEFVEQKCDEADAELHCILHREFLDLEAESELHSINVDEMSNIGFRCVTRAEKIATANDIKDPVERERVKEERKREPGTALMMLKMWDDTLATQRTSQNIRNRMTDMESSLKALLAAADRRFRSYDGFLQGIGSLDEVYDVEEPPRSKKKLEDQAAGASEG